MAIEQSLVLDLEKVTIKSDRDLSFFSCRELLPEALFNSLLSPQMDHLFVSHSGFCSHVGARAVSRSTSRGRGTHAHIVRNSNESGLTRTEKRTTLCYPHDPRDCLVDPTRPVPRVLGGWALSLWERYPCTKVRTPSPPRLLLHYSRA